MDVNAGDNLPPLLWRKPSLGVSLLIAAAVLAVVAYVRLVLLPKNVLPIAYGVPLLICIWFRDRRILWGLVAGFMLITFIKYEQFNNDPNFPGNKRWIGWGVIMLDMLVIATIVHVLI